MSRARIQRPWSSDLHLRRAVGPGRTTNRALIGSFWIARSMAARASRRPRRRARRACGRACTTATQCSGLPLPEPMRVSAGFWVTGLSGNTRIHTLPPRRTWRVMAIRAASIWRAVSQPGSSAWIPKSPKLTVVPPLACAGHATALLLAVLDLARHQHVSRPPCGSAAPRGARGGCGARSLRLRRGGARARRARPAGRPGRPAAPRSTSASASARSRVGDRRLGEVSRRRRSSSSGRCPAHPLGRGGDRRRR